LTNQSSPLPVLTVLLPTYNPRLDHIQRVLEALRTQTAPTELWDLLIVDNNSSPPLTGLLDVSWHPRGRVLSVPTPGKMHALAAAFRATTTPLLLILDDDTVPTAELIAQILQVDKQYPVLGTWSTRVELEIEDPAIVPPARLRPLLAERLIETAMWSNDPLHSPSTAWGCGMTVRRAVADAYLAQTADNPSRLQLDPVGDQPGYGGDTDLSYTGFAIGLGTGVFPHLKITHLIPTRRCTVDYLIRNLEAHEFSHQLQHYARHGELPPPPGLGTKVRRWWKWLSGDSIDRAMLSAEQRGRAAARRTLATGRDTRPVTHR
jgi:glycosyltransferase involved in cell wall biosynthesis